MAYKITIEGIPSESDANYLIVELFKRDGVKSALIDPNASEVYGRLFGKTVVANTEHYRDAQELVDDMRLRGYTARYEEERVNQP